MIGAGPSANAALIRRAVEHLNATGDFDYSLYSDDVSFRTRGEVEASGTFHGHDGLRQALARFREVWGDGITLEVAEVLGTGDALAVVMRARVRGVQSGVELEVEETWATWLRDGKIARIEQYGAREDALRAAGLA